MYFFYFFIFLKKTEEVSWRRSRRKGDKMSGEGNGVGGRNVEKMMERVKGNEAW